MARLQLGCASVKGRDAEKRDRDEPEVDTIKLIPNVSLEAHMRGFYDPQHVD